MHDPLPKKQGIVHQFHLRFKKYGTWQLAILDSYWNQTCFFSFLFLSLLFFPSLPFFPSFFLMKVSLLPWQVCLVYTLFSLGTCCHQADDCSVGFGCCHYGCSWFGRVDAEFFGNTKSWPHMKPDHAFSFQRTFSSSLDPDKEGVRWLGGTTALFRWKTVPKKLRIMVTHLRASMARCPSILEIPLR